MLFGSSVLNLDVGIMRVGHGRSVVLDYLSESGREIFFPVGFTTYVIAVLGIRACRRGRYRGHGTHPLGIRYSVCPRLST